MSVTVRIPAPLRTLTKGQEEVSAQGASVAEVVEDLEKAYPGIKSRLCDEKGEVRRFVNIFLADEDIRFMQGLKTPVKTGDSISIVPAIAGGACAS